MNNFFLKQLQYNTDIFLKNVSKEYNLEYKKLKKKYYPKQLKKKYIDLINSKDNVNFYKNYYKDKEGKKYIIFQDNNSNYNAILIN